MYRKCRITDYSDYKDCSRPEKCPDPSSEYITREEAILLIRLYARGLRGEKGDQGPRGDQGPAVHLISESYELSSQGNPPGLRIDQ